MTRILKTSGFLGLAVMMSVRLYQNVLLASGSTPPAWMVGGHAHLGVLSILAIVVGFVVGQWGLPGTVWVGESGTLPQLMPTSVLWGLCLIAAMLILAWQAATTDASPGGPTASAETPADD
jgi:hypothetical protein